MIKTLFFLQHPKLQVATRCWGLEIRLRFVLFSLFLRNLKIRDVTNTQGKAHEENCPCGDCTSAARGFIMSTPRNPTSDTRVGPEGGQPRVRLVIHLVHEKARGKCSLSREHFPGRKASTVEPRSPPRRQRRAAS